MSPDISKVNASISCLIRKHLLGELSAEDHEKLAKWIEEDPCNQRLFIQLGLIYKEDMELKDVTGRKKMPFLKRLLHSVRSPFRFFVCVVLFFVPC